MMKQNCGDIQVWSEEGVGTRFDLYFPMTDFEPSPVQLEERRDGWETGEETVLLVEDEIAAGIKTLLARPASRFEGKRPSSYGGPSIGGIQTDTGGLELGSIRFPSMTPPFYTVNQSVWLCASCAAPNRASNETCELARLESAPVSADLKIRAESQKSSP